MLDALQIAALKNKSHINNLQFELRKKWFSG